ncbi:MAG: hypothetical protein FWH21_02485 [Kiritimatiellaeota bacterium]|nr:hypothetical protein [Kiritimatiellota bacterium]
MGNKNSGRRSKPIVGKPKPIRVPRPDGGVTFIGITDAARYLGCSPSSLSAVCRGVRNRGTRLLKRAKRIFPQLFVD